MRSQISKTQISKMRKIKLFSLIIFTIIFTFLPIVFLTIVSKANASLSLSISPPIITIQAVPPAEVSADFSITNSENEPVELEINLKPFSETSEKDGKVKFINFEDLDSRKKDLLKRIKIYKDGKILERGFTLSPKQKKKLSLKVNIPKNYTASDLYFSIIFLSLPKRDSQFTHSQVSQGIAINILLSIVRNESFQAEITRFDSESLFNDRIVKFNLEITNKGNSFITPEGSITIKNVFGQTMDRIKLDSIYILKNSSRLMTNYNQLDETTIRSIKNKELKIYWLKPFIPGYYIATAEINFSEAKKSQTKRISFITFPSKNAIMIIAFIILGIILTKKITKKLKTQNI